MRTLIAASAASMAVLALGACASSSTASNPSYSEEYRQLAAQCAEDGGVLIPSGALSMSANPQADFACSRRDRLLGSN